MSARRKFCSGGGGGGDPKKAPHKYKRGLPHAEKLAKNILLKYSYIFASEKVLRKRNPKRTNYTINKHSGEYAPICTLKYSAQQYNIFDFYKNEYFYNFYKIVAKYTPERIKLHHFKKFSRESMSPNSLACK